MGEAKLNVDCRFCEQRHRPRFLCNPAKRAALVAEVTEMAIRRAKELTL